MKNKKIRICALACALVCFVALLCSCAGDYVGQAAKDADDYVIALSYDEEGHRLSAAQKVTFTNRTSAELSAVKFHVWANCYREGAKRPIVFPSHDGDAYPNGASFGDVSFDSVKVDGNAVAFEICGDDLDVLSVPVELKAGQTVSVEMIYVVTLANISHRLGYGHSTVNLGNFYPQLCRQNADGTFDENPYDCHGDPFVSEIANYDVSLTAPSKYVVASTGSLKEVSVGEDDFATRKYLAEGVRDFAATLCERYEQLTAQTDGVVVDYFCFADEQKQATLDLATAAVKFFGEKIAPYPYSRLTVAEMDFCYGGMEYPMLATVASRLDDYQTAVVHEIAHQWFYGVVGSDQVNEPWMDEGLCEFLTALFFDEQGRTSLSEWAKQTCKAYVTYVDVLQNYKNAVDTSFRPLSAYKTSADYVYTVYVKGSLLFYTLFDAMGQNKFYKALRSYFDVAKMKIATKEDMVQAFCKAAGGDVSGIFRSFAEGNDVVARGDA